MKADKSKMHVDEFKIFVFKYYKVPGAVVDVANPEDVNTYTIVITITTMKIKKLKPTTMYLCQEIKQNAIVPEPKK